MKLLQIEGPKVDPCGTADFTRTGTEKVSEIRTEDGLVFK
jgi:hypothetical protein